MSELDEQIAAAEDEIAAQTDEFHAREQVIEVLSDVLESQQRQPVYLAPAKSVKAPNYILYIGIGIAVLFFLKRK